MNLADWKHYQFVKDRVYRIPASQFKMWKPGIVDRPMRTNFYEIITEFHEIFKDELTRAGQIDYQTITAASIVGVPEEIAEWFKVIIECRFRVLILGENFDSVWEEVARRYHYDLH